MAHLALDIPSHITTVAAAAVTHPESFQMLSCADQRHSVLAALAIDVSAAKFLLLLLLRVRRREGHLSARASERSRGGDCLYADMLCGAAGADLI